VGREVFGSLEETILLVDDDAALLEVTSIVLASEGYRVLTAEDGVEALRILGRETLDLVVLDIMLPRMSGFEVLKKMREQSDVPVVLLTAKSQSVDKVVGLELGADDYITKPFDTKELQARIKAVLRRFGRQEGKDRDGVIRLGPLEPERGTPGPDADGIQDPGFVDAATGAGFHASPDLRGRLHRLALSGQPIHRRPHQQTPGQGRGRPVEAGDHTDRPKRRLPGSPAGLEDTDGKDR
jgi:CheY-like chemotaxis protein